MRLFNKYRTKKLLKKLIESSKKLDEDKSVYVLNSKDPKEVYDAVISKFDLEITKVAIYFDEIKKTYPHFSDVEKDSDLWKLQKPKTSEGTSFTTTNSGFLSNILRPVTSLAGIRHYQKHDRINEANLVPWFKKAMITNNDKMYLNKCKKKCKHIRLSSELSNIVYAEAEVLIANQNGKCLGNTSSFLTFSILQQIAKTTNTNILTDIS